MTKRIMAACALLLLVTALVVWSCRTVSQSVEQLDSILEKARECVLRHDFTNAERYASEFEAKYNMFEPAFIAFLSRDMFYDIKYSAAAIKSYNDPETYLDMVAEIDRTRDKIEILWQSTFRLI